MLQRAIFLIIRILFGMRIMILTFARIKYSYNNYQKVIIFAMRKKTKERRDAEKELLYYLEIYTELRGREGVGEVLVFYDELIQEALEKIKMMY